MVRKRLIARLDVKGENLIKGIQLEGLRIVGDPQKFAKKYYEEGIDEIIYIDSVASLYGRNNLHAIVENTTKEIFVPVTVGGGIRNVEDARRLLNCGTEKIAVNTAAVKRPKLISELAEAFGSQAVVVSIEAKREGEDWEAYVDNGRERSGLDVLDWASCVEQLGAGEILLTSVDKEGTRKGFDIDLVRAVSGNLDIPVIASGGMGKLFDLANVVQNGKADAVAVADALHYDRFTIREMKRAMRGQL